MDPEVLNWRVSWFKVRLQNSFSSDPVGWLKLKNPYILPWCLRGAARLGITTSVLRSCDWPDLSERSAQSCDLRPEDDHPCIQATMQWTKYIDETKLWCKIFLSYCHVTNRLENVFTNDVWGKESWYYSIGCSIAYLFMVLGIEPMFHLLEKHVATESISSNHHFHFETELEAYKSVELIYPVVAFHSNLVIQHQNEVGSTRSHDVESIWT